MSLPFVPPRLSKIFVWHRFVPIKQWAEENITLINGATRGRFRVNAAPHLEFIFEQIDKAHVNMVVLKVASQTQKTTTLLAAIMKWIATDYHDIFIMLPKASDIKKFLEFKVNPFIQGTKVVDEMMKYYRQKESERKHSRYHKTAQNLFSVISKNETKTITTKYGIFDEAADFEPGKIEEALERMKTYGLTNKVIIASTQIHEYDEINHFFNGCEAKYQQRLICPKCDEVFYPSPETLSYPSEDDYKEKFALSELDNNALLSDYRPYAMRNAGIKCPNCEYFISNKERVSLIRNKKFKWVQVVPQSVDDGGAVWVEAKKYKDYYESVGIDTNTVFSPSVPLLKFVEAELSCKYAPPHLQRVLYEKYYAGWWNKLYEDNTKEKIKRSEILNLDNGIPYKVVPNDTNTLHIGVDLQKDRLYYMVIAVHFSKDIKISIIEYDELYSDGVGNDFAMLEDILFQDYFNENGELYKIYSGGLDIRGFSLKDSTSRSREALDFIAKIAYEKQGDDNWNSFLYPSLGVEALPARYEVDGYKTQPRELKYNDENIKVYDAVYSNKAIKDLVFEMMRNGIEGKDGNTLYITNQITIDFENRQNLSKDERRDKHSLEAHLTSEHLTYKITNGKPAKHKTYEKIYDGVRNDWLDCLCIATTQTLLHKTYGQEDNHIDVDVKTILKDAF